MFNTYNVCLGNELQSYTISNIICDISSQILIYHCLTSTMFLFSIRNLGNKLQNTIAMLISISFVMF